MLITILKYLMTNNSQLLFYDNNKTKHILSIWGKHVRILFCFS